MCGLVGVKSLSLDTPSNLLINSANVGVYSHLSAEQIGAPPPR